MNVFAWHVHGSWMTSFVQGPHTYYVPVEPGRGPDGRGRALTWDWPMNVVEVSPEDAAGVDIDVLLLQRPTEWSLAEEWLGGLHRFPVVYVEHDTPPHDGDRRHPFADHDDVTVVHVTHFNQGAWDCGGTRTEVVEHGVLDPGHRWTGELPSAVAAINEPVRRSWVVGLDLLDEVAARAPVDLFGMQSEAIGGRDVPQAQLHVEMAQRRVYVHPFRWTSLGLALLEAMMMGMPVVATAATEVPRVLTPEVGGLATTGTELADHVCRLLQDDAAAVAAGAAARRIAVERFNVDRFLADWDRLFERIVR